MTNNEKALGSIRTGVPALVGLILARLVAAVPAVQDVFDWLVENAGVEVVGLISTVATALVITGYYAAIRWLSDRWPWLEAFLGSTKAPVAFVDKTQP